MHLSDFVTNPIAMQPEIALATLLAAQHKATLVSKKFAPLPLDNALLTPQKFAD